jgi:hypothetical protein
MRCTTLLRVSRRYALLAAICLLLGAGATFATRAHAGGGARPSSGVGNWTAAVALPVPSPGDVSYGVARVRIVPGSRLIAPSGLAGQQTIFAGSVGGLSVTARSPSWRALRATTHVYVVVSRVRGGSSSLRDIAFFILRRKALQGPANANVVFTIANAQAQVGSFWVHGVDRHGYATIFAVRNILSTAVGNWSRYIRALQVAHAIAAAAHPLLGALAPTASASAARGQTPGPWTGGQRPSRRVVAMYHLIFSALADPASYAAVKKDPLVADFIDNELHNSALASRWRTVVAQVPLKVPDQYAAAAQEEKRFTRVRAPKITHAVVAFFDGDNSGVQGGGDFPSPPLALLLVSKTGSGSGTVTDSAPTGRINCGLVCYETFSTTSAFVSLTATPGSGSIFSGWSAHCLPGTPLDRCDMRVIGSEEVFARFDATGAPRTYALTVYATSEQTGQTGTVTSSPAGINCATGSSCTVSFTAGTAVTLTKNPSPGSTLGHWDGCPSVSGATCTVTMDQPRLVGAFFGYP